ncbi:unnamed protein product [Acanthoscelides obtectus]|uniref:Carboxypeptidase n=1 Tax=Acanthoscelides obtectus TaxID=200917 RepID=A0A9P0PLF2_ACAOB|nr:unnamed protein product [Acanthoscelides obtectus]CAK1630913.1 hypothetical protein AOBTE_LOCUS6637 [Acanthoscelides obtectus]
MNLQARLLFLLAYCSATSWALIPHINPFKLQEVEYHGDDVGEPLILTPLLEQGRIKDARIAASVSLSGCAKDITSYAGYFTINKQYNSNLYFWFFPSTSDYKKDPVVLWLQGGPGGPSMYGLLMENGPFTVNKDLELELRNNSWTNSHSVIYIDSPVGTGFSFTENEKGYARNQSQVGSELYEALQQFFQLFPEIRKNDFFVTGESYAGKYVPALAYTIHKNNPDAQEKINLKGIAIGDGYIDPEHQVGYAEYLYQLGLVDKMSSNVIKYLEDKAATYISRGDYIKSKEVTDEAFNIIMEKTKVNIYNYLQQGNSVIGEDLMKEFLNKHIVRRAIHVGRTTFGSNKVYHYLSEDIPRSIAPWFVEVANNYRVLLYTGQLDIIVAYPLTLNFLKHVEFRDIQKYHKAQRKIWYVGRELAGYSKNAGNFTEVLVRNAGHMVPFDQPKWAENLITRFTRNKPF